MSDIHIISPTRAEAGPLASVIAALPEAKVVDFCWQALEVNATHAIALGWYTEEFKEKNPRLVLLLGDRYETHAAALAAHFLRIPIGHVHGGETTTGSFDDALRHGITHMAKLHFVATEQSARLVNQMINGPGLGGLAENVHLVGAPGLDGIVEGSAKRDQKLIVVSYYSETTAADYGIENCKAMLAALEPYTKDHAIFFSQVNSDPGSSDIAGLLDEFISEHPTSASVITPNTREQYLHLCEYASFAIGNSSALVIECPWMGLPSVLVGDRQKGRPLAKSVFQFESYNFPLGLAGAGPLPGAETSEPIYRGGAAEKIAKVVREWLA